MTIKIGDAVKTHWGDGIVTAIYESNGIGRTGLKLLIEWIDVEIDGKELSKENVAGEIIKEPEQMSAFISYRDDPEMQAKHSSGTEYYSQFGLSAPMMPSKNGPREPMKLGKEHEKTVCEVGS